MNSDIFNNPLFQSLAPEKLRFIQEFHQMAKPSDSKQATPFFMQMMQQARQKGIQFTPNETELLIQLLKSNMSEADQKKADMMLRFFHRKNWAEHTLEASCYMGNLMS